MDLAQIQQWVVIFLTLFVYTVLYKDNPLYRLVEHIFIGAAAGYAIVLGLIPVYTKAIVPMLEGNFTYMLPVIIGFLMFGIVLKEQYWISRYPIALLIGAGTGLSLRATPKAKILAQIQPMLSIVGKDIFSTFSNIILWMAVVTPIIYFTYTREHKGTLGNIAKIGRVFMLAAFGASYGGTVMTRLAILIPQVQRIVLQNVMATMACLILVVVVFFYQAKKSKP